MSKCIKVGVLLLCVGVAVAQMDYLGASCTGAVCDNGLECLTLSGTECLSVGLDGEEQCTCGGVGGESDPFFTGFLGQKFYFSSEPDTTYALLSELEHFVNAHFVATEVPSESDLIARVTGVENGSFVGSVAVGHKGTRLLVSADHLGTVKVEIDGQQIDLGADDSDFQVTMYLPSGMHFAVEKLPVIQETLITIETDLIFLTAFPVGVHRDNMGNNVRGHLNLQLSLKREPESAHGILGQTIYEDEFEQDSESTRFPGEGTASSYEVSSMFGTDFEFNLFDTAVTEARPSKVYSLLGSQSTTLNVSRKLLAEKEKRAPKLVMATFGIERKNAL